MKAKQYKKIQRLHQKAHGRILDVGLKTHKQPLRKWIVKWAYWHNQKAHQNKLKWYGAFTEGWKFGADANQIRKDHNYPEFNPKTAGSDETWDSTVWIDVLSPYERLVALTLVEGHIDEGIN